MSKKQKTKIESIISPKLPAPALGATIKVGIIVGAIVLAGSLGASGYFYKQMKDLKANPNQVATEEVKSVIDAVGQLMILPTNEEPTLATVTDPEKLREQAFFSSALKGDKVLIYTNSKKAVLYRPSDNKIIEVAPINIGSTDQSQAQVSGTSTEKNTK